MPKGDGWYLFGPLVAVALIGFLGALFWRLGLALGCIVGRDESDGLAIFGEPDDYGLLYPAAVTDEPEVAEEIRDLLRDAGIRTTQASVSRAGAGRVIAVLVFAEELEEARRLVSPPL